MPKRLSSFVGDTRGATAMEYGLIAALVAMVVVVAWSGMGSALRGHFNNVAVQVNK